MRPTQLGKSVFLASLLLSVPSFAFLTETNKKMVLIGKGGAENMQSVEVATIAQPAYPNSYSSNTYNTNNYNNQNYNQNYNNQGYDQSYNSQSYGSYQNGNYQNSYSNQNYNNQNNNQYNNPNQSYNSGITINNQQQYHYPTYSNQPVASYQPAAGGQLFVDTNAVAAMVFDLQTGQVLYEKNSDIARSIASITKMMTAMVVLDAAQNMNEELVIQSSDLVGAKSYTAKLSAGDRLTRKEFLLLMLMKSNNSAAKALARNYYSGYDGFIAAMNDKAASLGMNQTRFSDSSGLSARNVSSAKDLVKMMKEIATNPRYETLKNFSATKSYDFGVDNYNKGYRIYKAASTNRLLREGLYPITVSKTGYIREAGYCVVMETHINGRPAIIVLLGAKDSVNRWRDAETILTQLSYR